MGMRLGTIVFAGATVAAFGQTGSWYLSGRVMLDDGGPPPYPVSIQTVCNGSAYLAAVTDSNGQFGFRTGGPGGGLPQNASVGRTESMLGRLQSPLEGPGSATPTMDPLTGRTSTQQQSGGTDSQQTSTTGSASRLAPVERTLDNCVLQADLPGYLPATVSLANRRPMDDPSVGTLILRRIESVEGRTVSVTTLAAPKAARSAYENGRKAAAQDRLDEARSQFEKAVRIYPKYAPAWTSLGNVQARQNQPEKAARSFETAIQADPKYAPPYLQLAVAQASQRKWDELISTTDEAVKLDTADRAQAYFLNALGNFNLRKLEAAEKSARECERLDALHRWPQTWHILGLILASRGEFAEAASQLREYLRLAPQSADAERARTLLARAEELSGK